MNSKWPCKWNAGYSESVHTFANTINTHEGGLRRRLPAALTSVVNKYAKDKKLLKDKDPNLRVKTSRGSAAVISVKVAQPQFEGQTRQNWATPRSSPSFRRSATSSLRTGSSRILPDARTIVNKAVQSAQARLAARKAQELVRRKSATDLGGLPGKLADCCSTDPKIRNCTWWRGIRPRLGQERPGFDVPGDPCRCGQDHQRRKARIDRV